jgi:hypothetical protein
MRVSIHQSGGTRLATGRLKHILSEGPMRECIQCSAPELYRHGISQLVAKSFRTFQDGRLKGSYSQTGFWEITWSGRALASRNGKRE